MFKIGDRIQCVTDNWYKVSKGDFYYVSEIVSDQQIKLEGIYQLVLPSDFAAAPTDRERYPTDYLAENIINESAHAFENEFVTFDGERFDKEHQAINHSVNVIVMDKLECQQIQQKQVLPLLAAIIRKTM